MIKSSTLRSKGSFARFVVYDVARERVIMYTFEVLFPWLSTQENACRELLGNINIMIQVMV